MPKNIKIQGVLTKLLQKNKMMQFYASCIVHNVVLDGDIAGARRVQAKGQEES